MTVVWGTLLNNCMFDYDYDEPVEPYDYYNEDIILISKYLNDIYKKYIDNASVEQLSAGNTVEYYLEPFYPYVSKNVIVNINQNRFDFLTENGYTLDLITGKFIKKSS
jgi:hypothetical protein